MITDSPTPGAGEAGSGAAIVLPSPRADLVRSAGGITLAALVVLGGGYLAGRHAWVVGLGVGIALMAYGGLALRRAASVRRWPLVPARVLGSAVAELIVPAKYSRHIEYYPVVQYEYDTGAGRFTSRRYTIAPRDYREWHPAAARALLAPYPAGASIRVHVCPGRPRVAVVRADISRRRRSQYLAAIVAGVMVCAVAVWAAM